MARSRASASASLSTGSKPEPEWFMLIPFSGFLSFSYWIRRIPVRTVLALSITNRSFFFGLYGLSLIMVCIILITFWFSSSGSLFQVTLPLDTNAFLNMGPFKEIFGFQSWRLVSVPHSTWMSLLMDGFFKSKNACTCLSLGWILTTCSFSALSARISAPPNSISSLIFILEGFNFRFFSWQNPRNIYGAAVQYNFIHVLDAWLPSYLMVPSVR